MLKSRTSTATGADHVIGGFAREALSSALAAIHRAGFGPQTRVIDGARGDIAQQLQRLGVGVPWEEPPTPDAVLIVVNAPGRTALVADLLSRFGAEFVELIGRGAGDRPTTDVIVSLAPDIRIGNDENAGADA